MSNIIVSSKSDLKFQMLGGGGGGGGGKGVAGLQPPLGGPLKYDKTPRIFLQNQCFNLQSTN